MFGIGRRVFRGMEEGGKAYYGGKGNGRVIGGVRGRRGLVGAGAKGHSVSTFKLFPSIFVEVERDPSTFAASVRKNENARTIFYFECIQRTMADCTC